MDSLISVLFSCARVQLAIWAHSGSCMGRPAPAEDPRTRLGIRPGTRLGTRLGPSPDPGCISVSVYNEVPISPCGRGLYIQLPYNV